MADFQDQFSAALLDPALPVPPGLTNPDGTPATKRFDVYRNNVVASLTKALAEAFPVVHKLVGEAFFNSLAGVFVRAHPPQSTFLAMYGAALPDFLEGFEHTAKLPYLPDVARLEQAIRESYHAADSTGAEVGVLQAMAPDRLMAVRFSFAPAMRLIRSPWPVFAIWDANTRPDAPKVQMRADDVVILRPKFDPYPALMPPGGGAFVAALLQGQSLGAAVEAAGEGFDLTAALSDLINGQAITAILEDP